MIPTPVYITVSILTYLIGLVIGYSLRGVGDGRKR